MFEIKKLTPEMCEAYIDFFEKRAFSDGNVNRGCYCVWHHWTAQHEEERSLLPGNKRPEVKKQFAAQLIREGKLNGFAAFCEEKMVGFCNADRKSEYFRLSRENAPAIWTEGEDSNATFSIVCFTVAPEMRGKGIASALLSAACEYAAANGYRYVEAYPSGESFSSDRCSGSNDMYRKRGFQIRDAGGETVARLGL